MVIEEWVLMAHGDQPDAYDYLATSKVGDLTVAQLEQTLENSFLNKTNIEFWKGPITMNKLLEVSRTYPGAGMPIPEEGGVTQVTITSGENYDIQPPGSEIWRITGMSMNGVGGQATGAITYFDGTTQQPVASGLAVTTGGVIIGAYGAVSDVQILNPILLTNAVYWKVLETGASYNIILTFSYQKVSL